MAKVEIDTIDPESRLEIEITNEQWFECEIYGLVPGFEVWVNKEPICRIYSCGKVERLSKPNDE